jgi:hypothetical protein
VTAWISISLSARIGWRRCCTTGEGARCRGDFSQVLHNRGTFGEGEMGRAPGRGELSHDKSREGRRHGTPDLLQWKSWKVHRASSTEGRRCSQGKHSRALSYGSRDPTMPRSGQQPSARAERVATKGRAGASLVVVHEEEIPCALGRKAPCCRTPWRMGCAMQGRTHVVASGGTGPHSIF